MLLFYILFCHKLFFQRKSFDWWNQWHYFSFCINSRWTSGIWGSNVTNLTGTREWMLDWQNEEIATKCINTDMKSSCNCIYHTQFLSACPLYNKPYFLINLLSIYQIFMKKIIIRKHKSRQWWHQKVSKLFREHKFSRFMFARYHII